MLWLTKTYFSPTLCLLKVINPLLPRISLFEGRCFGGIERWKVFTLYKQMFCTLQGYVWSPFMPRSKEDNCATLMYASLINDIKNQHKLGSLILINPHNKRFRIRIAFKILAMMYYYLFLSVHHPDCPIRRAVNTYNQETNFQSGWQSSPWFSV